MALLRRLFKLSLLWAPLVGSSCLPEAVSAENRRYLSGDAAVRISAVERNSVQTVAAVAQVIIEEILGYHAVATNSSGPGAAPHVWLSLPCGRSGCEHVMVELPDESPEQLGCLGFAPEELFWIKGSIQRAAFDGQGLLLDHFRTYSSATTRASAANYFDQLSAFPTSELSSCQETSETLTPGLRQYLEDTGDSAGLTAGAAELGELQRNCSDDFWWLAPECRSSLDCIPLLLRDVEGLPLAMRSATAFGMPLGIARVNSLQSFVRLVKESNALFYWWYPDTLVMDDLQPQQLFFPRTPGDDSKLNRCSGKAVSASLKERAPRVRELIKRMSFSEDQLLEVLQVGRANTSLAEPVEIACNWLQSYDRWREWIRTPTCGKGYWHPSEQCMECQRGSICHPGETVRTLPGFYATVESPNQIYQCFGAASRCPGGPAGSCASGRDPTSLTCSACLPGFMPQGAQCVQCAQASAYFHFILMILLRVLAVGFLHFLLIIASSRKATSTSLLHAEIGFCELLTFVQMMDVIRQSNIEWAQQIVNLWRFRRVFKFDHMFSADVADCVLDSSPVTRFAFCVFGVPTIFVVAPALFHFLFARCWKSDLQPLKRRTSGTLFVVFFIDLLSSLTAALRCDTHPSDLQTLQVYPEILCNFRDEHLELIGVMGVGSLIPIFFLAYCFWIILQFPKRLHNGDSKFIRSSAFLTLRLRPGEWLFSLFLLCRNVLLVLCPLFVTSSGLAIVSLLLMASLVVTVYRRPWRATGSNLMDVLMHVCLLFILDLIPLYGGGENHDALAVVVAMLVVLLAFAVTILYGLGKYFWIRYRKPFQFFICHHKAGAGSFARLIKMELQRRVPKIHVFVDSDQLKDLTQPLCHVGYEVERLILLGTPKVLLQKWCVAELVIARLQNIPSVLVQLPDFRMPDATFITNYTTAAPQMHDLASYGIHFREIKDTILWVCKLEVLRLPDLHSEALPSSVNSVINSLTDSHGPALSMNDPCPEFVILADPENMTATATAYVLWGLLDPHFFTQDMGSCIVLNKGADLPSDLVSLLFICTEGCFETQQVLTWLLQACDMPGCYVLPVLIDDHFRFPAADFYSDIFKNQNSNDHEYHQAFIETVFWEAAGSFTPSISPGVDLAHQASQMVQRIKLRTRTDVIHARPLGRANSMAGPSDRLEVYMRKSSLLNRLSSLIHQTPPNKKDISEASESHTSCGEEKEEEMAVVVAKLPSELEEAEAEEMTQVEM